MGHRKGGPKPGTVYPHLWASGPDPVRHKQHQVWVQQRNQAQWRGEEWDFAFEDWIILWGDLWQHRGRGSDQYCMTRVDKEAAWTKLNCIVITREQHFANHRDQQYATKRRKRGELLDEQNKTRERSSKVE